MRTQIVLCVVGAGCAALALAFALREQSARAAAARGSAMRAEEVREAQAERRAELVPTRALEGADEPLTVEAPDAGRRELGGRAPELSGLAGGLIEEFLRAHERGLIGDQELAAMLVRTYLANGESQLALELLRAYGSEDLGLWWAVAQALGGQGDRAGQREVLLAALEHWPDQQALIDQLIVVDPAAAIARLRALLASQSPPGDLELRGRLARALAAGGGRDEARALVEALLAENPGNVEAIAMMAEFDPARALTLLESGFAGSDEPEVMRAAMLDILLGTGNPAAAANVLERFEREGQAVDPSEWGMVAEAWLSNGDTVRGTAAMQRALAQEHGDPDSWVHSLEELAPDELHAALERRVASDEALNDEYWGSLADSYWRAGRPADARAAWERAYELDREDGEWPARLEALRAGRDPYDG